jgi:hypothetical protein
VPPLTPRRRRGGLVVPPAPAQRGRAGCPAFGGRTASSPRCRRPRGPAPPPGAGGPSPAMAPPPWRGGGGGGPASGGATAGRPLTRAHPPRRGGGRQRGAQSPRPIGGAEAPPHNRKNRVSGFILTQLLFRFLPPATLPPLTGLQAARHWCKPRRSFTYQRLAPLVSGCRQKEPALRLAIKKERPHY